MSRTALILAGGYGTRLRSVTKTPKSLIKFSGRTFLEYTLDKLGRQDFTEVVLCLHYGAQDFVDHFQERYAGIKIAYDIQDKALGTGGSIKAALLGVMDKKEVFVINGDTFVGVDYGAVIKRHRETKLPVVVIKRLSDTRRYGVVSRNGIFLNGFMEKTKPGSGLINAGVYLIPTNLFDKLPIKEEAFSFETAILENSRSHLSWVTYETKQKFLDIGIPSDHDWLQDNPSFLFNHAD